MGFDTAGTFRLLAPLALWEGSIFATRKRKLENNGVGKEDLAQLLIGRVSSRLDRGFRIGIEPGR